MSAPFDWSQLSARDEAGHLIVTPCLALNLYVDEIVPDQVLDFFERARGLVGKQLTHYMAESMAQPAKITPRALGMLATWLRKPKEGHRYKIRFWGGEGRDISAWHISIDLSCVAPDPERRARAPKFFAELENRPVQVEVPLTVLRVTVPVDGEAARPESWVPWVCNLRLVREGALQLGESGYSLNIWDDIEPIGIQYAMCARYPGLDWFSPRHGGYLRRYEPSLDAVLPQVRRAAWLTFIHDTAVQVLGGVDRIQRELADEPQIVLHRVAHGLGLQAGPRPELGDLSRHDLIPLQRRVAHLLRPVRLQGVPLAYYEDFVEHWFNMFDKDHA